MSAVSPGPAVLLMGDERETLLRLAGIALEQGCTVTLTGDAAARLDGYACVAVGFRPGAAHDLAAARMTAERVHGFVLHGGISDDEWSACLLSARETAAPDGNAAPGCVVVSTFRVANGMSEAVARAFRDRPRRVDAHAGFRGLQVLSPGEDPDEFWLLTQWDDEQTYEAWHHSHLYREAHTGIPRGLRLDPAATRVRLFRSIAR